MLIANEYQITALKRAIAKLEWLGTEEQTVCQLKQVLEILESQR